MHHFTLQKREGRGNKSFVADMLENYQTHMDSIEYEEAVKFAAVTLYGGRSYGSPYFPLLKHCLKVDQILYVLVSSRCNARTNRAHLSNILP